LIFVAAFRLRAGFQAALCGIRMLIRPLLLFFLCLTVWSQTQNEGERGILTPAVSPKPRINGPKVYGVRPGHPFLYLIPATGERPMKFSARKLPKGLKLDSASGVISGIVEKAGEYSVRLAAANSLGRTERKLRIVVGKTLALTPPMGWSSWYMAYANIDDKLIRAQADAMMSSGLANHGYSYVNIDDGWNIKPESADPAIGGDPRNTDGTLKANRNFPDMNALTDYVHNKGLKIGIYISPGPRTCGGYEGSYQHEEQDARLFAEWGFDFLKYDLCSYSKLMKNPNDAEELQKAYSLMGTNLQKLDRDFVFNLCEYGRGDVWKWGREVGGNFWRTAGDLGDPKKGLWDSVSNIGFSQAGKEQWAGPGGWNDPDNILIGHILQHKELVPTPLTHNEQYTHVTLWALLAAPMVFGGDMTQLDPFTLSLLTNDEVIDVDQDSLGKQAKPVYHSGDLQVWAKDLEDGSKAVGLFNLGESETEVTAQWSDLGIQGKRVVRDIWRQKDVGVFDNEFHTSVGRHGAALLVIRASR
jgi:alpha-galactosidase